MPLQTKTAEVVIQAYIDQVYAKFGGSLKILSDNGTEFKNKLFEQVAKELGVEYKLYTSPYHPASNGRIEGFHAFLKACIAKHVAPQLEWDALVPLACAAYNFIPNEHSKESPFFLMFGRDPVLPLNTLLEPKLQYLGNDINILLLAAPIYHLSILLILYLFSYLVMATTPHTSHIPTSPSEDTQTSGTDLEEINTEDEMNTDTSKWSEKEKKKLQHMTEFHEEYQRVFGDKASLCTIIRKRIAHMNPPPFHLQYVKKKCKMLI